MPRANRHFIAGYVLHITHRCHKREFLLKFLRDRKRWLYWLFQAKKRYGLTILNYVVTSNHIHLLVKDNGNNEISKSMQLIAGRTAQEYNQRKNRKGAFWEDRYHATAIDTHSYLIKCLVYMDMNMVRARAINHPAEWSHSGYHEIQHPALRYAHIDLAELLRLTGEKELSSFQKHHCQWIEQAITLQAFERESQWSESLAVGSENYAEAVKSKMGLAGKYRNTKKRGGDYVVREEYLPYSHHLGYKNTTLS